MSGEVLVPEVTSDLVRRSEIFSENDTEGAITQMANYFGENGLKDLRTVFDEFLVADSDFFGIPKDKNSSTHIAPNKSGSVLNQVIAAEKQIVGDFGHMLTPDFSANGDDFVESVGQHAEMYGDTIYYNLLILNSNGLKIKLELEERFASWLEDREYKLFRSKQGEITWNKIKNEHGRKLHKKTQKRLHGSDLIQEQNDVVAKPGDFDDLEVVYKQELPEDQVPDGRIIQDDQLPEVTPKEKPSKPEDYLVEVDDNSELDEAEKIWLGSDPSRKYLDGLSTEQRASFAQIDTALREGKGKDLLQLITTPLIEEINLNKVEIELTGKENESVRMRWVDYLAAYGEVGRAANGQLHVDLDGQIPERIDEDWFEEFCDRVEFGENVDEEVIEVESVGVLGRLNDFTSEEVKNRLAEVVLFLLKNQGSVEANVDDFDNVSLRAASDDENADAKRAPFVKWSRLALVLGISAELREQVDKDAMENLLNRIKIIED